MAPVGRLHKRNIAAEIVPRAHPPAALAVAAEDPAPHERVLVVDGDRASLARTAYLLASAGYRVTTTRTAAEARRLIRSDRPVLVVVRSVLPDGAGLELARRLTLHQFGYRAASILLLGPEETDDDRLRALALGADECLTPSAPDAELLIRARALLRRIAPPASPCDEPTPDEIHEVGALWLNATYPEARASGAPLLLSRAEFALLRLLMSRPGVVVRHEEVQRVASGTGVPLKPASARMLVRRLRMKLGPHAEMVLAVPPRGYVLRAVPNR